jgi:hypothetical protein
VSLASRNAVHSIRAQRMLKKWFMH